VRWTNPRLSLVLERYGLTRAARATAGAAAERYVHGIVTSSLMMTICYNE
jgi:hypothetical protein